MITEKQVQTETHRAISGELTEVYLGNPTGNGELLISEYRVTVQDDEKVLEMDSSGGCST